MISLTPTDSARVLLLVIQHIRQQIKAGPNFTLANLATLLAVCENPGLLQPDIADAVGGVDGTTLARQLSLLAGRSRTEGGEAPLALIYTDRHPQNRRLNDVFLTEDGQKFSQDLSAYFSRVLTRTIDRH